MIIFESKICVFLNSETKKENLKNGNYWNQERKYFF
jgi:hypothetical protein